MTRLGSLFYGATLPFRAALLICQHKGLLIWSALPIALTLGLYGLILTHLNSWASAQISSWPAWSGILLKILLFLLSALTFTFTASIVSSPFNDRLAEEAEKYAHPPLPPIEKQNLFGRAHLIWIDLIKTIAATTALFVTLIFSWVPYLNLVALTLAALLQAFQYTSYPQTRRRMRLGVGFRFLFAHFFVCLGLGITLLFLFSIPLVSSFALPMAVVSGTLLVARAASGLK